MMKKIFSLMILAMFIISMVPLTLAEEGNSNQAQNGDGYGTESDAVILDSAEAETTSELEVISESDDLDVEIETTTIEPKNKPILLAYKKLQERVAKNKPELIKALPKFDEEQKKLMSKEFSRARFEWCLKNEKECKNVLKNLVNDLKEAKETVKEKKQISKEKAIEARERYAKAKEFYQEKLEKAKDRRANFLELKEKKEASEQEKVEAAKEYLIEKIELVMGHLDKLKERVESTESMDEEKATAIVERIDTEMAKLEELVDKTKEAQTKEDIRAVVERLKKIWKGFQPETKGYAIGLMHAKVNDIIVRSNELEKKLDSMIEGAELRDIDVSIVDEAVNEFSQKIESARQAYVDSKDMLQEATDFRKDLKEPSDAEIEKYNIMVKEANEKLKEARDLIQEANELLKDIIKELKEAYGGVLPQVDNEEDVGSDEDVSGSGQAEEVPMED